MDGKIQAESPKQPLSSTTNRDDSEQVGGRHDNQGWHHGPLMRKKRTTKRREAIAKRAYMEGSPQRIPQSRREHHQQKAKDMHLAIDDKPTTSA